jgi:hypothetical protein
MLQCSPNISEDVHSAAELGRPSILNLPILFQVNFPVREGVDPLSRVREPHLFFYTRLLC